ncbi:hypothetical protein RHMOL_Rhmol04G0203900 [Rhododendron molle]|uniref:Uncharacterized protein n=1 Tax=Rhododendron molle TaxID=49168 RepID=A0ACC0P4Q8_RHOML|nr:hypothetical protein RHMOL_Rhmol04G0203900 [Rhododendron molle]
MEPVTVLRQELESQSTELEVIEPRHRASYSHKARASSLLFSTAVASSPPPPPIDTTANAPSAALKYSSKAPAIEAMVLGGILGSHVLRLTHHTPIVRGALHNPTFVK